MKIEWTKEFDDLHVGNAGKLLEARITPSDREWLTTVKLVARDDHEEIAYDHALRPTIGEAKAAAQEIVNYALAPFVATARTEAALAEREACAAWFDDRAASYERQSTLVRDNPASFGGDSVAQELAENLADAGAQARLDARTIRARTTPATLSTDTLAAIAEARGLRVVKARAEVISFAEAMEAALAKNEHKGGWKDDGALELHQRIVEETDELRAELMKRRERPGHANNQAPILSEAADVANFAMMVADVCGCLESRSKDGAK